MKVSMNETSWLVRLVGDYQEDRKWSYELEMLRNVYIYDAEKRGYEYSPWKWQHLCVVFILFLFFGVGRLLYDGYMRFRRRGKPDSEGTPYSLSRELVDRDNKASAIDFASFLLCIMIVARGGVDVSQHDRSQNYFAHIFWYQFIGLLACLTSRLLNDVLVLSSVANTEAIVANRNVGAACVQASAAVASAIVIYGSTAGEDPEGSFWMGFAGTAIFWPLGQLLLIGHILILNQCTKMKLPDALKAQEEHRKSQNLEGGGVEKLAIPGTLMEGPAKDFSTNAFTYLRQAGTDNVACGLAVSGEVLAAALLLARDGLAGADPGYAGWSLCAYFIWVAVTLAVAMPLMHLLLDLLLLRGVKYTSNILIHQNWGAGLLVGTLKVCTALMLSALYQKECHAYSYEAGDPGTCDKPSVDTSKLSSMLDATNVPHIFQIKTLINFAVLLSIFLLCKALMWVRLALVKGFSFSISKQLAEPQNNAIAVSLTGKCLSMTLVMVGLLECSEDHADDHLGTLVGWLAIGIVFMLCAQLLNDLILVPKTTNAKELLADNVAIACLEAGSYISCGLITQACVSGVTDNFWAGLLLSIIYWAMSQILFLLIMFGYRLMTAFNDLEQLLANNVAVGVSSGLTLVAIGIVMNSAIVYNGSIWAFLPIVAISVLLLGLLRLFIDKVLLPTRALDKELTEDRNWGAALVEGLAAVSFALTIKILLPSEPELQCRSWELTEAFFKLPR